LSRSFRSAIRLAASVVTVDRNDSTARTNARRMAGLFTNILHHAMKVLHHT
jgi:hypothetical protein